MKSSTLKDLGYDDYFHSAWKSLEWSGLKAARVIAEHKGLYRVCAAEGEFIARVTGKQMFDATKREDYPAVGDWVAIAINDNDSAAIHHILPRKTILRRKYCNKQESQIVATNIDTAFVVQALDRDFNLNRLERFFVIANDGGIAPAIILNKADLVTENELQQIMSKIAKRFGQVDVYTTSTVSGQDIERLKSYLHKGKTYCLIGSSGVGKSTIINRLLNNADIKTQIISSATGRGKHTTTAREMHLLENGAILIDNPGTRELGVTDMRDGIDNVFDEISHLQKQCKFDDCTHTHEPGCAVLAAIKTNDLDEKRYINYQKLKKENAYYESSAQEKRAKDRQFGKHIKKTIEQLKATDARFD